MKWSQRLRQEDIKIPGRGQDRAKPPRLLIQLYRQGRREDRLEETERSTQSTKPDARLMHGFWLQVPPRQVDPSEHVALATTQNRRQRDIRRFSGIEGR